MVATNTFLIVTSSANAGSRHCAGNQNHGDNNRNDDDDDTIAHAVAVAHHKRPLDGLVESALSLHATNLSHLLGPGRQRRVEDRGDHIRPKVGDDAIKRAPIGEADVKQHVLSNDVLTMLPPCTPRAAMMSLLGTVFHSLVSAISTMGWWSVVLAITDCNAAFKTSAPATAVSSRP
eukprot:CAMPEP_0195136000 /NCGR_PEP_ID=MMETSP0448-20130528/153467_1 /TAXON_ID=66468 /ORGANISM="Heterocapsa triquestra, Strain CCMP 448" /LENGTH=175 /DNA_ID=CAMNT_0040174169 /DNA_START=216 /DNA_END=744 /DNA_ORIENTATION=-